MIVSVVSACGGEETLDDEKVEEYVRAGARVPQAIAEVVCPEEREAQEGDAFECTIRLRSGGEEAVELRQEDADGTVRVIAHRQTKLPPDAAAVRIVPENVEEHIRANAPQPERILSVGCPADVKLERGATFECLVRFLDGSAELVEITQVDELGNVKLTGSRKRATRPRR